jgi:hypothetical protein
MAHRAQELNSEWEPTCSYLWSQAGLLWSLRILWELRRIIQWSTFKKLNMLERKLSCSSSFLVTACLYCWLMFLVTKYGIQIWPRNVGRWYVSLVLYKALPTGVNTVADWPFFFLEICSALIFVHSWSALLFVESDLESGGYHCQFARNNWGQAEADTGRQLPGSSWWPACLVDWP